MKLHVAFAVFMVSVEHFNPTDAYITASNEKSSQDNIHQP